MFITPVAGVYVAKVGVCALVPTDVIGTGLLYA